MNIKTTALITLSALTLVACSSRDKEKAQEEMTVAHAELMTATKQDKGKVNLQETKEGIRVTVDISGLKPKSTHGLHIHQNGKCDAPSFETAGGHFNPHSTAHGGPNSAEKHPGDFGNIIADAQGNAKKEIMISKDQVAELKEIEGKAIILHEKADDLTSQPSGNSGGRMACGLIM